MKNHHLLLFTVLIFLVLGGTFLFAQMAPDTLFSQEYHVPYSVGTSRTANNVFSIAVDRADNIWIGTEAGVFRLKKGEKTWQALLDSAAMGPTFAIENGPDGSMWVGTWNGLYRSTKSGLKKVAGIRQPISAICVTPKEVLALGPDANWRFRNGQLQSLRIPISRAVRAAISDRKGGTWIATGMGLVHWKSDTLLLFQSTKQLLSAEVNDVLVTRDGALWVAQTGGITVYRKGKRVRDFSTGSHLPNLTVRALAEGPDGRIWAGTEYGLARFDGREWSVRLSRRWLLNNHVWDVAFDSQGTAWVATAGGVSAIYTRRLTLAQKFAHYHRIVLKRHIRPPGFIGSCRLAAPGDTLHWKPEDSDNDGLHTGRYLAMESLRYAATGNPDARERARKAFHAMLQLQTITRTPGFFARSIIPVTWKTMHDANRHFTEKQWALEHVKNPRNKRVEKRWRLSADGKHLWKGDTSSDEMTGHMFGYLFYYDLAADKAEKKLVRNLVCRIMDTIIRDGFVLKDIDGTHTKWAVWSPKLLNHDPDWAAERGINSLEMLSYLKAAFHISGNKKYERVYRNLIKKHHFAENARHAKTYNPAWRTHIDDGLLPLVYPALFLYEKDPDLIKIYQESLDWWYDGVKRDRTPLVDFVYALCTGKPTQLDDTLFALRDAPLDLINWRVDNSRREDVRLVHSESFEGFQTNRWLPPSERGWNHNPWDPVQGNGGYSEEDANWWMLGYWLGRAYGFISAPK